MHKQFLPAWTVAFTLFAHSALGQTMPEAARQYVGKWHQPPPPSCDWRRNGTAGAYEVILTVSGFDQNTKMFAGRFQSIGCFKTEVEFSTNKDDLFRTARLADSGELTIAFKGDNGPITYHLNRQGEKLTGRLDNSYGSHFDISMKKE